MAINWWGNPPSPGKRFSDTLDAVAAVHMRTVQTDAGKTRWMAGVFAGTHASRADKDVVDGGLYMLRRHLMYCHPFVLAAVPRARNLSHLACTEAAEGGTDKIITTVLLKPRVIIVQSDQIQFEAKRSLTLLSAEDKTAAARAIVRRLCSSG